LSLIYAEEEEYLKAAHYYQEGLQNSHKVKAKKHYHLGKLFVLAGKPKPAFREFDTYLRQKPIAEKTIKSLFSFLKKHNYLEELVNSKELQDKHHPWRRLLDLYVAKAFIELDELESAKEKLNAINANKSEPLAFYLLAKVAKKQKDWDTMELSIQRATVLDPNNGNYWNILADSLIYQKKYVPAVEYIQKALANDPDNQSYRKKLSKIKSISR
jgi:tetratricopeptide (TPR) repeat protein